MAAAAREPQGCKRRAHGVGRRKVEADRQIAARRQPHGPRVELALAAEDDKQTDLAIAHYRRAVQTQPDYADAQFNLALLLTHLDRCDEALAAWQRFLEVEPSGKHAATAQKAIALCRMKIQQDKAQTG
jgi:tetratricopeptide (TPR) repeat protein